MAKVCFCPVDPARPRDDGPFRRGELPGARCVGSLKRDGTFELSTFADQDGAQAGHYKVFLMASENIEPGPPIIPFQYTEYDQSPWVVEIKPGEENFFELILE